MKQLTQLNVVEFLNSNETKNSKGEFVEVDSEITLKALQFCIKFINFAETDMNRIKIDVIKQNYYSIDDDARQGVVNKDMLYMIRVISPYVTNVSQSEVNIALAAYNAFTGMKEVAVDVTERMYGICEMLAKDYRIKFYRNNGQPCFSFYALKSMSEQILDRVKAGENKIVVSMDDLSEATARVYCTRIKKKTGKQISCTVSGRKIVFYTGGVSAINMYEDEIRSVMEKYSHINYDSIVEATNRIASEFAPKILNISQSDRNLRSIVPIDSPADEPIWKQYGYDNEQDYLDYQSKKQADLDSWDEPDIIKEAEGLQQYVMPIADTEPVKPTHTEYDDF